MMEEFDVLTRLVTDFVEQSIQLAPKMLSGLLLILVGWIIGWLLSSGVRRLAERLQIRKLLDRGGLLTTLERSGISQSPAQMLGSFVFWLIFLLYDTNTYSDEPFPWCSFIITESRFYESLHRPGQVLVDQGIVGIFPVTEILMILV